MSDFNRYATAIDKCAETAKREIENLVARLDTSRKKSARDVLLAEVPRIVDRCGAMAASAAAEYYELNRRRQIGGEYRAKLGSSEKREDVESSVRYACGHLFTKEADDGK